MSLNASSGNLAGFADKLWTMANWKTSSQSFSKQKQYKVPSKHFQWKVIWECSMPCFLLLWSDVRINCERKSRPRVCETVKTAPRRSHYLNWKTWEDQRVQEMVSRRPNRYIIREMMATYLILYIFIQKPVTWSYRLSSVAGAILFAALYTCSSCQVSQ